MENLWKMGIKSEQKLGKSLNKQGFPFPWECVRVLWRSWLHIVKLNEWTSVTAIVNFCPMTCRLCYEPEFTILFWPHHRLPVYMIIIYMMYRTYKSALKFCFCIEKRQSICELCPWTPPRPVSGSGPHTIKLACAAHFEFLRYAQVLWMGTQPSLTHGHPQAELRHCLRNTSTHTFKQHTNFATIFQNFPPRLRFLIPEIQSV